MILQMLIFMAAVRADTAIYKPVSVKPEGNGKYEIHIQGKSEGKLVTETYSTPKCSGHEDELCCESDVETRVRVIDYKKTPPDKREGPGAEKRFVVSKGIDGNWELKILGPDEKCPDASAFLCFGDGYSYTTRAPRGWKLDNPSGKPNSRCLVGYPEGGSWEKSETVIYLNATSKGKVRGNRNLSEMIEFDISQHKKASPKVLVAPGQPVFNKNKRVPVRHFSGSKGDFEAVGYIDEANAVIFVVMTSRSKPEFEKGIPVFNEFIANYRFLKDKVVIQKK